jgi:hypothetical protein
MKIRAIAGASERSNVIGTLELEASPHGLAVTYLGAGAFTEGYAPGALAQGTQLLVPWPSLEFAEVGPDRVFLVVNAALTPLNRMELTTFSSGDVLSERELQRQRLVVRLATLGTGTVVFSLVALIVLRLAPEAGALVALFAGAVAAVAVFAAGALSLYRLGSPVAEGERVREAFILDLARFVPKLAPAPPPEAKPFQFVLPDLDRLLPRTTLATAITLSALALGAVLTGSWILTGGRSAESPVSRLEPGASEPGPLNTEAEAPPKVPAPAKPTSAPPVAASSAEATPKAPKGLVRSPGTCRCDRADSPLWPAPPLKLTTLLLSERLSYVGERRRPELEVSVAAINASDRDLEKVALTARFFERDPPPSSKRYEVQSRAMFFEGPLTPGQAIKWTVEARGTEVEIDAPNLGRIGEAGEGAAPTNLLAELLGANNRPVRVQGARLLGYLGDARARSAALELREAQRDEEEPLLSRLIEATSDTRVCSLRVVRSGGRARFGACVYNAGQSKVSGIGVGLRAVAGTVNLERPGTPPPTLISEWAWPVPGEIGPGQGASVGVDFEWNDPLPEEPAYEARADRVDLLGH